jgi:hypothetical protein
MLWLNTRRMTLIFGLTAIIAALVQIVLNVNFLVLLLALISIACGLYGFWLCGVFNIAGWVCFFYMAGNVLIALYAKTILLQSLNSNLFDPISSFGVQAICCFAMLLAMIFAFWIDVGKPLLPPVTDLTLLRLLSAGCLIIGLGVKALQFAVARGAADQGEAGGSYGGLFAFGTLTYLGIIARTALVMQRSNGKRLIDPLLIAMIAVTTLSGVLSTGKEEAAIPTLSFVLTVLFFKGRLPWRYVAGIAAGIALYLTIAPLMLTFRYMGFGKMSLSKEIDIIENMAPDLLSGDSFADLVAKHAHTKSLAYDYYGDNGKGQLILGRYSSIQQIDPVIYATDIRGTLGGDIILDGFRSYFPKFLAPDKPKDITGLTVIKSLGIYKGGGSHPTVPLAAIVYSAYGTMGVIFIPLATFLLYLLMLKKISWDIRGNIFAIFLLAIQVNGIHSAEFRLYVGYIFRDTPLMVIIILLMQKGAEFMVRQRRELVATAQ